MPARGTPLASRTWICTRGAVAPGATTAPLFASIDKIDHRLIEASSDLYANPFVGFFKVTWPLSLPGVVSGTLLTFIPAAGDYINAQLLGSPNQRMVGNVIPLMGNLCDQLTDQMGKVVDQIVGAVPKASIEAKIAAHAT